MSGNAGAVSDERVAGRAHWEPDIETGEPGLVAKVVRLNLLVTKALEDVATKAGINLADYLVLGVVRRSPGERTTPSRIAEVLRRTTGGMTLTINRLEQAGWLVRTADQDDRRRVHVTLTPAGRALAVSVNDDLHRWEDRLALPARARQRIESEFDALLALFED
ncbi:MAG: regulatory protein MarR [Ilumatobacteraceae bacterium]|nr:regulatory protein MarR [Ilumatobacteraceae bacterium]